MATAAQMSKEERLLETAKAVPAEFAAEAVDYQKSQNQKGSLPEEIVAGDQDDEPEAVDLPADGPQPEPYEPYIIIQAEGHSATVSIAKAMSQPGVKPAVYELVVQQTKREAAAEIIQGFLR